MRYQEEIAAQAHWAAEKARAQALEEGRSEGRQEGLNEGRKEKAIEMIKNLVAVGTPMEFIIKATGWSEKQILQISQWSNYSILETVFTNRSSIYSFLLNWKEVYDYARKCKNGKVE